MIFLMFVPSQDFKSAITLALVLFDVDKEVFNTLYLPVQDRLGAFRIPQSIYQRKSFE